MPQAVGHTSVPGRAYTVCMTGRTRVSLGQRQDGLVPGWWCDAEVEGRRYRVGVLAIPTETSRPDTWGIVRNEKGKIIWQERVPAGISPRELLRRADLVD